MSEDYYEILGVERDATPEQIKRAYRKLSRKYHPDIAGVEHEEQFKKISVAYETLSNPKKRQSYDMGGSMGGPGMGGMGGFGGFGDLFETFFSAAGATGGPMPRGRRGQDILTALEVDLNTIAFGSREEVTINTAVKCPTCDGTATKPGTSPRTCTVCNGSGTVRHVQRSILGDIMTQAPCSTCGGYGTIITDPCEECGGEGRVHAKRTIAVDVPAGIEHGTRIRLSGQGEAGPGGGGNGDLYVEVHEKRHPVFKRQGDDLLANLFVPMTSAALGTTITLDTLDGPQEITVEPGTQPGEEVRLEGLGVGRLHRKGRGNLRARINVQVPKDLDPEQRELIEKLAKLRGEETVEAKTEPESQGFFSNLKEKFTR
ncbi:MAG: molecular chaperone DnaJ [Actinomycetaceae bacterium]|nr:molecular chaperone DnaJ [Actinomycetaceae bacterium]